MQKKYRSAKDIAFDEERAKFRSEIRGLKYAVEQKDLQIEELTELIRQKDEQIVELNEWIERLLEYTEIPKEDLKKLIESEKEKAETRERISSTFGILLAGCKKTIKHMRDFTEEESKSYTEALNNMYETIGVNILDSSTVSIERNKVGKRS